MKKHIVCFGDSNTHGYCPLPDGVSVVRFDEETRWPMVLQTGLGHEDYLVIEEGRSGRTTVFPDPLTPGLCALDYLHPCLKSHEPIDLLIVMLGTNDVKERFGASASVIAQGMERLIKEAKLVDCWGGKTPNILVMAPLAVREEIMTIPKGEGMGVACLEKSRRLPGEYLAVAQRNGCHYFDVNTLDCQYNDVDFMHMTAHSHKVLAQALIELVPSLMG